MIRSSLLASVALSTAFLISACQDAALSSATAPDAPPPFDSAAMDTLLSGAVDRGEVIGVSALVFDDGHRVYENEFGLGDRERGVAVTDDTVWRIYSMTKPMTSVMIMDLVEEGKIALNDPVSKFIPAMGQMKVAQLGEDGMPEFVDQVDPMTVEDLLLHTAGLGYGIFGPVSPVEEAYIQADLFSPAETMEQKVAKLAQLPLIGQPGEQWFYSYSIDVLGRIVEVVTEQSLGEAMQERLFGPLGMSETGFAVRDDQTPRFVSNYVIQEDGSFALAEDGQTSPFLAANGHVYQSGGGGLVSTRGDVARFAEMMLRGGELDGVRILDEATVELMMTDHTGHDSALPYLLPWIGGQTGAGFGYGGSVQVTASEAQQTEAGRYPGQWGWGGAARTNFWIDPQNDAFGIIMLQFFSPEDPPLHDDFQALVLAETRDD